ncbi:Anoctamin-9, partial [Nibea albiflora]
TALTMAPLKTKNICFLFLFLSVVPTLAEVVRSVSDCNEFLLEKTPPRVPGVLESGNILDQNRYKPICQTYKNQRTFVTVYDTKNKIPVFSAYKYRGEGEGRRPPNDWRIEPQLENEDDRNKNMMIGDRKKNYTNQAENTDYRRNRWFDRGHLFPSSHAFTKAAKNSTFTLTNIVPQARTFNQGSWNRMEKCIKCVMDEYCTNNNGVVEGFVVTGAQPSTNNILKNRINIPSHALVSILLLQLQHEDVDIECALG